MKNTPSEIYDYIVVGAGIAGLKNAKTLKKAGLKGIILERQDRIGGRLFAVSDEKTKIDIGGSWLHGQDNPLLQHAKKLNIGRQPTYYSLADALSKFKSMIIYDRRNRKLPAKELHDILNEIKKFSKYLDKHTDEFEGKKSQAEAADDFCRINQFPPEKKKLFKDILQLIISSDNGVFPNKISAGENLVSLDEENKGGADSIFYPESYDQIVKHLAVKANVIINRTVTKIDYKNKVVKVYATVTTEENKEQTIKEEIYFCRRVFVTVPIGVLKSRQIEFKPQLLEDAEGAIQKLNSGNFKKIVLLFSEVFWENKEWLVFLRNDGLYEVMNYASFRNQRNIPGNILVFFVQGELSDRLDKLSEKSVVNLLLDILADVYKTIPVKQLLLKSAVSNWAKDPAFLGSYSSLGPESMLDDHKKIAGPHGKENNLILGGEAASLRKEYSDYGTTHGAYQSGKEAAARMLFFDMSPLAQFIFGLNLPCPYFFKAMISKVKALLKENEFLAMPPLLVEARDKASRGRTYLLQSQCSFFGTQLYWSECEHPPEAPAAPAPVRTMPMRPYA